ncbi:MAG: FxLYD domain-containing protein, partial [Aggregatilineales bacterium]
EMIGVLDVVLPSGTEAQSTELEQIVNTFSLNPDAELAPTETTVLIAAAQADLEVRDVSAWWTSNGVFFITGEVLNHSGTALTDITLVTNLYDTAGNTIAQANDHVMGYAILPGEFAPFSLRFDQPTDAVRYTLTLDGGVPLEDPIITEDALTWTFESTRTDEGHLLVNGEVTNTGNRTARNALLTITVFDENGDVIAAGFILLDDTRIDPDQTVPYSIRVPEIGGEPANFFINVQAQQ